MLSLPGQVSPPKDWTTWGYDAERTGWNRGETALSKENVGRLELKWKTKLNTPEREMVLSTLTTPLVVDGVVVVVGADDTVYALNADSGKAVWSREFPNTQKPKLVSTWLCPNTQNATPVVDRAKGIVYVTTSDGKLRGLDLASGKDRMAPFDAVVPFARNWSLNLIDDVIYTPTARGCGGATSTFTAIDVSDAAHPSMATFYSSDGRAAGAWGPGGMVRGPRGLYTQTADGIYDPAAGQFGNTVLALSFKTLRLVDSFTPSNWLDMDKKDLDLGAGEPVVFPFGNKNIVASSAKEGLVYLLDASALGGGTFNHENRYSAADHFKPLWTSPRYGNDQEFLDGRGVWGAMATSTDAQRKRWLYVPMWGPPAKDAPKFQNSYGAAPRGSIMAFQVTGEPAAPSLTSMWISRDMQVPSSPVVANGVVYAIQTGENTIQFAPPAAPAVGAVVSSDGPLGQNGRAGGGGRGPTGNPAVAAKLRATPVTNEVLYAFDAETGKELYSSGNIIPSWTHFSSPVVAMGKVFVVTWDGQVYAFGLK